MPEHTPLLSLLRPGLTAPPTWAPTVQVKLTVTPDISRAVTQVTVKGQWLKSLAAGHVAPACQAVAGSGLPPGGRLGISPLCPSGQITPSMPRKGALSLRTPRKPDYCLPTVNLGAGRMEVSSITFNRSCRRRWALVGRRGAREQAVEIANKDDLFLRLSAAPIPAAPDSGGPTTEGIRVPASAGQSRGSGNPVPLSGTPETPVVWLVCFLGVGAAWWGGSEICIGELHPESALGRCDGGGWQTQGKGRTGWRWSPPRARESRASLVAEW